MYETPKSIFQQRLKETMTSKTSDVVTDLVKLSLVKQAEKDEGLLVFAELFNLLKIEKFTEVLSLIDGRTLTFPAREQFKDSVITVLCYYYKNVENKDWEEIKVLLGDPNLNTIKYGIRATTFEKFLNQMMERLSEQPGS